MRAAAGSGALPDICSQRHRARPSTAGLGEAWGSREPVRGGREHSVPWGAAMGCRRLPGPVLALLLLLRPPPSAACPAACRCSPGEADCSERGLLGVPWSLSANTSALWLGYNFITVLGPRSFPPLPGLRLLSLAHNRLELIHPQALLGLGALQELDLSHNHLSVLTPDTFLPLTSLATLNLVSNRLEQLEPGVPGALPQLRALLLQDNPWVCSCSILPLWRWLSHNREKVRGSGRRSAVSWGRRAAAGAAGKLEPQCGAGVEVSATIQSHFPWRIPGQESCCVSATCWPWPCPGDVSVQERWEPGSRLAALHGSGVPRAQG
ncbi:leucine-rich repeat-containing protein 26 isoform X2 [Haemorhous mexicanus]|uniref:leucine-rich repeat-containing protein 26 isoform X2 n=1 Tax=Haemorhous mexicanus TaxID=30427 RepID=UPI0028BF317E|nr:leucine-rich repeat-containing protein 26 isoform X2 [Haemorhous mexicanus]